MLHRSQRTEEYKTELKDTIEYCSVKLKRAQKGLTNSAKGKMTAQTFKVRELQDNIMWTNNHIMQVPEE